MKISVVAYEQPDPDGTAAGRALWTWCEGVLALGHELDAWSWYPQPPRRELPAWCRWQPLDDVPMARAHVRGMVTPRMESSRAGWAPAPGAVAVADDVPSFAAVARAEHSVVTVHYRAALDGLALHRTNLPALQTQRAERRAGRRAALVLAFSDRVAQRLGRRNKPTHFVPIAYPVPEQPLAFVEEPVAALIADWSWRPNHRALAWLLSAWPSVRDLTPGARLLVAGRHLDRARIGAMPGVEVLGEVGASRDVLAQAAVVAFPCPATSGPKVKVLEALAHGVAVVTTPAGVEGLVLQPGQGAVVAPRHDFAASLARTLGSPEYRRQLASSGYHAVVAHHSALPVARARLAALEATFAARVSSTV